MPTVLITGASTGIGRATALRLASRGWTVLAGVRDPAAGEQLASDGAAGARGGAPPDGTHPQVGHEHPPKGHEQAGERVIPVTLDVLDTAQIAQAAALVEQRGGRLDALVNNAGIGVGGPLELISAEDLRRQFEVNVFAQIAVTQALLPALRAAHGRIAFVSSIGGRVATPFTAPYAASKHAIEAFGDALRVELRTSGVQVTLIEPGSVATPIWGKSQVEADKLAIPPALGSVYGEVPAAMEKALADTAARGIPPERVAETIERALGSRRMRARYLVGRDAQAMLALKRLLPDHTFDRLIRRALGL